VILDAVKKRAPSALTTARSRTPTMGIQVNTSMNAGPRDRVEDLLASIIGLDHIKSQVRKLQFSS